LRIGKGGGVVVGGGGGIHVDVTEQKSVGISVKSELASRNRRKADVFVRPREGKNFQSPRGSEIGD